MKCYYVDSHEREDVVKYRSGFVKRYLEDEIRMHRWTQWPLDSADLQKLFDNDELKDDQGFVYSTDAGIQMIEYHVDDHKWFFDWANDNCKYGGNLSVRMKPDDKPLICFGQDEAIMKENLVWSKAWKGVNGEVGLVPKDDGRGLMISAFVLRDWLSGRLE